MIRRPDTSRTSADTSTNVPTPGAFAQMMDDLRAHPPRYILDTTPAAFRGSQYSPMSKRPELRQFVDSRYEYIETIDGIAIYKARTPEQATDRR